MLELNWATLQLFRSQLSKTCGWIGIELASPSLLNIRVRVRVGPYPKPTPKRLKNWPKVNILKGSRMTASVSPFFSASGLLYMLYVWVFMSLRVRFMAFAPPSQIWTVFYSASHAFRVCSHFSHRHVEYISFLFNTHCSLIQISPIFHEFFTFRYIHKRSCPLCWRPPRSHVQMQ